MSSWIVRNAVLTPECGNGVWTRHRTRVGALISRRRILALRHGSGFYVIPAGGLIVCRPVVPSEPKDGQR